MGKKEEKNLKNKKRDDDGNWVDEQREQKRMNK